MAATNAKPANPGVTELFRRRSWMLQKQIFPYLLIAPFFIIFIVFFLRPALYAFYASFHDWNLLGAMKFTGLKNYLILSRDSTFFLSFTNTLIYIASGLFLQWPLALILAVILNQDKLPGKRIFSASYFIPVLTSTVVIGLVFSLFLDKKYGLFNYPLFKLGLDPLNWLGSRQLSKYAVILLVTWRWTGYNMVFFLAALQAIPKELYEAAQVDGANRFQSFFYITLPMMRPAIGYVIILGMIGGWQIFDEPYILTKGGPSDSSLSVAYYLYRVSITNLRMGYGSAIGSVTFVMVMLLTILQLRFFGVYSKTAENKA
jgi:ABC-type sugar transport system permease subunit